MKAPKSLPPPTNWQDFETLCTRLWSEIWNCPDISKNGRSGQTQHGVDIYGIPFNEKNYYGIQCKGKSSYSNKQFTFKEIETEISKAKKFKPALKKFYLATTALKDAKIEEFIRSKNLENIQNGLFELYLVSWEDIVEKILELPKVYEWYEKSIGFLETRGAFVSFLNGKSSIKLRPIFSKVTHIPRQSVAAINGLSRIAFPTALIGGFHRQVNMSLAECSLIIKNTGSRPIKSLKLYLKLDKNISEVKESNIENDIRFITDKSNIDIDQKFGSITIVVSNEGVLVPGDTLYSDHFYLKTNFENTTINANWSLYSEDFQDEGLMTIQIMPELIEYTQEYLEDDPLKVKSGPFSDGITPHLVSIQIFEELIKEGFTQIVSD